MSHRSEHGTTLLELMIAIAVVGITGVALLGGMATGIASSGMHREQADVGTVLASAVEAVKDQSRNPYQHCSQAWPYWMPTRPPSTYDATKGLPPLLPATVKDVRVTDVWYWNGSQFQPSCLEFDAGSQYYFTLQLITVTVTSSTGQVSQARSFVKRRP